MRTPIYIILTLLMGISNVQAGSLNKLLKNIDTSIDAGEDSHQERSNNKIKKIEKLPPANTRSDQDAYLVVKFDIQALDGDDRINNVIKSFMTNDDVCLALSGVSMITDTKPNKSNELKNSFNQEKRQNHDQGYSLTMLRLDGSVYELSSKENFYSNFEPKVINTDKGNDFIRQKEEAKLTAEKLSKEAAEADAIAFEDYMRPGEAASAMYEEKVDKLKKEGALVFKKLYLGMPLTYVAERSSQVIQRVRTELSLFGFEFKPTGPNETPDRIIIKFRDSIMSEILFNGENKYRVVDGIYYRGATPLRDVEVNSFTLDRDVLDAMFDTKDLKSEDIIKQFCESYKVPVPVVWVPKREYRAGDRGLGVGEDYMSTYNFSDERGFNLTFICFDNKRACSLILEKTKPRAEIGKSFD